jgi:hypothetical protein
MPAVATPAKRSSDATSAPFGKDRVLLIDKLRDWIYGNTFADWFPHYCK